MDEDHDAMREKKMVVSNVDFKWAAEKGSGVNGEALLTKPTLVWAKVL